MKKNCEILTKKKTITTNLAVFLCVIGGDLLLTSLFEYSFSINNGFNPYRFWIVFVVLCLLTMTIIYRKYIWKYAHLYFFMASMLVGSANVLAISPMPYLSWDDQIHYARTAYMSHGANGTISKADSDAVNVGWQLFSMHGTNILQKDIRDEWKCHVNAIDNKDLTDYEETVNYQYVAYIPASISLFLGRVIGLNFTDNFILGKFVNLLCYAAILSFAIRNLRGRGKILTAALGLIPTMLYMATAYSYDWWVYAFSILGYSVFIGEIQKEGKIGTGKLLQAVTIIVIGMLPKAVYFPLLFPLMLMRKEKYSDSKKSRGIVVIAMLVLLASFTLPILVSGAGSGDARGGSEVNASEQLIFVLSNIGVYIKILLKFLWDYLSPDKAYDYLTNMAYLGYAKYYTICMLVLGIAAVLDNDGIVVFGKKEQLMKYGSYIGVFGALVLVATALYISFTAVASETIAGCQSRYILPVLFPILFFGGENEIQVPQKTRERMFVLVVNTMAFVFLLGCYELCVSLY